VNWTGRDEATGWRWERDDQDTPAQAYDRDGEPVADPGDCPIGLGRPGDDW
jgi:hypothetical protein